MLCSMQSLGDTGPFLSWFHILPGGFHISLCIWVANREREREGTGSCRGIIGAGLEVVAPISAHVFWPQVRHSAPSACETAQGRASRRDGKGIWGTSCSCLSPQRGPCEGGGRALPTALPRASHREGELIRRITDGRSKQGGSQAYVQEGLTLRQRVCRHCEPPLSHQSAGWWQRLRALQ